MHVQGARSGATPALGPAAAAPPRPSDAAPISPLAPQSPAPRQLPRCGWGPPWPPPAPRSACASTWTAAAARRSRRSAPTRRRIPARRPSVQPLPPRSPATCRPPSGPWMPACPWQASLLHPGGCWLLPQECMPWLPVYDDALSGSVRDRPRQLSAVVPFPMPVAPRALCSCSLLFCSPPLLFRSLPLLSLSLLPTSCCPSSCPLRPPCRHPALAARRGVPGGAPPALHDRQPSTYLRHPWTGSCCDRFGCSGSCTQQCRTCSVDGGRRGALPGVTGAAAAAGGAAGKGEPGQGHATTAVCPVHALQALQLCCTTLAR